MTRTPEQRLVDIRDATERVNQAMDTLSRAEVSGTDEEAQLAFDALLYRLLIIGEAVKALPASVTASESQVPWRDIARLRDLLAHHYYRVDPQVIRGTVEEPLRELQSAAGRLLASSRPQL